MELKQNNQRHLIAGILSLECNLLANFLLITYCNSVAADSEAIAGSIFYVPVFAIPIVGGYLLGNFSARKLKIGVFGVRISLLIAAIVTLLLVLPFFGLWNFVFNFCKAVSKVSELIN